MSRRIRILAGALLFGCLIMLYLNFISGKDEKLRKDLHLMPMDSACHTYFDSFMIKGQDGRPEPTLRERIQAMRAYNACFFKHRHTVSNSNDYLKDVNRKVFPMFKEGVKIDSSRYANRVGVVTAIDASNMHFLPRLVGVIRMLDNNIPIEIAHWGSLDESYRLQVMDAGGHRKIKFRNVGEYISDDFQDMNAWTLNFLAMIFSEFADVVYIEPDTVPLTKLGHHFQGIDYQITGALFFRDRYIPNEYYSAKEQNIYQQLMPTSEEMVAFRMNLDYDDRHIFEASILKNQVSGGMVLMDKKRHLLGLLIGLMLQIEKTTSEPTLGCKELMWISQYIAGDSDFTINEQYPGAIGELVKNDDDSREITSTHLAQMNTDLDLLWISGGMQTCPLESWQEDWNSVPELRQKFQDEKALKDSYLKSFHPHYVLVPSDETSPKPDEKSRFKSWLQIKEEGCRGYYWRSKDSPKQPGRMKKLSTDDVDFLDDIRRAWKLENI